MTAAQQDQRGFVQALIGDGRPLLICGGLGLILSGGFALFLAVTGHFLPHDVAFLGMTPEQLCAIDECRIVHFMIHDRAAFGGSIIAVGLLYLWLAQFPLRRRQAWAWWLFLLSGVLGFSSFLAYLGYGYLDSWHGVATLGLLPCFVIGLTQSYSSLRGTRNIRCLFRPSIRMSWTSTFGVGRACLLTASAGLIAGGSTVMVIGMTCVFVPQDLAYMGLSTSELHAINPRLVPLIAHDRAGFGGGVATCGLLMLFAVWSGPPSRNLWQVLCLAGIAGFGTAIGVHPAIGYNDFIHLAPAIVGASLFGTGLLLTFKPMVIQSGKSTKGSSRTPSTFILP